MRPREKVGSMHNSALPKALEFKQLIDDIAHENACEMRGRYKRRHNDKEGSESVHRKTKTHQNTKTHRYLPKRTMIIGFFYIGYDTV